MPQSQYNALSLYLTGPAGEDYDFGVNVINTSFAAATLTMLENATPQNEDKFVYGAVVRFPVGKLNWMHHSPNSDATPRPEPEPETEPQHPRAFRVAVFTEKGGVGKTSVAAHLAGALLHLGRDAVLVDCDSQKNLSLLLGDGVNVRDKHGKVSTLVIEGIKSFNESDYENYFIIFDCAPNFETNDARVFRSVTDTVIPIVLSPLSVLGNAEVIGRTITQIRSVNPNMHFHVVINQYEQSKAAANYQNQLLQFIRHCLRNAGLASDSRVKFYNPEQMSVRRSDLMLHWGMFLLKAGEPPRLAFDSHSNGSTRLLGDFLALAGLIEERMNDD